MTTRMLDDAPSPLPLMLKAALPTIPVVSSLPGVRKTTRELPDLELVREGVPVDADHVGRTPRCAASPPRMRSR